MSAYSDATLADADLKAYWRLGEPSGTSAADASGRGNGGTYVNSPTLGSDSLIVGDSDTAVDFVFGSHVQLTDHADLEPGTAYTLEFWCQRVSVADNTAFYSKGTGGNFYGMANGTFRIGNDSGTVCTSTSTALSDTNTHHVVVTYAGTGAGNTKIYIDGTEGHTDGAQIGTGLSANSTNPRIGQYFSSGEDGLVILDEMAIYSAVKSGAWVAARYALGTTLTQLLVPDADTVTTGWSTAPLWSKVNASGGDTITATSS